MILSRFTDPKIYRRVTEPPTKGSLSNDRKNIDTRDASLWSQKVGIRYSDSLFVGGLEHNFGGTGTVYEEHENCSSVPHRQTPWWKSSEPEIELVGEIDG
jgi:hypothetical protein